jgi:hypothetical protein
MNENNINELVEPLTSGKSFTWQKPITRKVTVYLVALLLIAGVLSLILVSPLLLRQLAKIKGIDWTNLSNIGQTYGAASAILSAVALIGIALSLFIQARQAKIERVRITRERQMELLRIILDAPEVYSPVIGVGAYFSAEAAPSEVDTRRFLFCTMWVNYARMGFEAGVLTEEILHDDIFGPAFESDPMRKWWARVRKYWSGNLIQGRKEHRFVQIIDEEYRKAEKAGPAIAPSAKDDAPKIVTTTTSKRYNTLAGTALGVTLGIIIGSRMRPNRR